MLLPTNNRIRSIFKRLPVDQELARKPAGKRSVAMAQRGNSERHRCYGNRTSHCVATKKGVSKRSR